MSELFQAAMALCAVVTLVSAAVGMYVGLRTDQRISSLEISVLKLLREYVSKEECRDCPARRFQRIAKEVDHA